MAEDFNQEDTLRRLRILASERLGIDPSHVRAGARLADIGIDSFAIIELVFAVEEEFGVRIPLDGVVVATVDDVLTVVRERLAASAADELKRR